LYTRKEINMNSINSDISNAFTSAAAQAATYTVLVDARHRQPASGIAFKPDLVVTANHVVERDEDIKVLLPDGSTLSATVAGRDPARDLVVLRLAEAKLSPAIPAAGPAAVGLPVLAVGRPDSDGIQASFGIVRALGGPVRTGRGALLESYIQSETNPYPGFSGGPLVALDGSLLGLNTSGLSMGSLLTIPVSIVWQAAETLAQHGHIRRGYLGIRSQSTPLSDANRAALGRPQEAGLLLVGVEQDSPAGKAGLLVGDILAAIASVPVNSHDDLQGQLDGALVGKKVDFEILRGGLRQVVAVEIGERA
jgi:S1-C subfamily serine protease